VVWTILLLYPAVVPDGQSLVGYWNENPLGRVFFFDNPNEPTYFWKQFVAGIFITIAMTGLDQDMMQKNLTCRSLPEAQKNMLWFSIVLIGVNVLFLFLGILLNDYAVAEGIAARGDSLYPAVALTGYLPPLAAGIFVIGLIAAAYSSADSALAALTTSFSVDILEVDRMPEAKAVATRRWVHVGTTVAMAVVIVLFQSLSNDSVVNGVFKAAGYTYGPLLGLFAFALFTRRGVRHWAAPVAALTAPVLTYWIQSQAPVWWGYTFGFELILLNGGLAFLLLALFSRRAA
jgi:Na+/proline symporter